jgi:hypothetical protein
MEPQYWGPCIWRAVHVIALGYPQQPTETDKQSYAAYYKELWKVLPCFKCSVNYKRHFQELPITDFLQSRDTLFEWTVHLHNIVNKELGKKELTVEEAKAINLSNNTAPKAKPKANILMWEIAMGIVLVLGIFLLAKKRMSR